MKLVFGLGKSGLGVLEFLKRRGQAARYYDDAPRPEDEARARELGFLPDEDPAPGVYDEVIAAPGVPLSHPLLRRLGAPVIGEAELAWREGRAEIIGVTGTAGKTSTTSYVAGALKELGFSAAAGGNIGTPLVSVVDEVEVAVAELSSFQLERTRDFSPKVAVLLNLGRDHLDRHGSIEAYHRAKLKLLENLGPDSALVYNASDPKIARAAQETGARLFPVYPTKDADQTNREFAKRAILAYLELRGTPLPEEEVARAVAEQPPVPGRFEVVGRLGELVFIDDSIATRTLAVKAALERAPAPVAWILGGVDKGADPVPLRPLVKEKVAVILAIGKDGERLAREFSDLVPVVAIRSRGERALAEAVSEGVRRIGRGSVLLAPLAASFDMFRDYRERSRAFRRAVKEVLWTPSS